MAAHIKNERIFGAPPPEAAPSAPEKAAATKIAPRPPAAAHEVERARYGGYAPASSGSALTLRTISQVQELLKADGNGPCALTLCHLVYPTVLPC